MYDVTRGPAAADGDGKRTDIFMVPEPKHSERLEPEPE